MALNYATEADNAFGILDKRISDMEDYSMFYNEARDLYTKANARARKTVNDFFKLSADPYLNAMENTLDEGSIAERVDLGILEIPVRQIVGSVSDSDEVLYTYDFMPLAEDASEFADSWCQMYQAYLSIRGLTDPIECVEYMGKFYVVDGKKRVSVLKAHGEIRVNAHVVRLVPVLSDDAQAKNTLIFRMFSLKPDCTRWSFPMRKIFPSCRKQWVWKQIRSGMSLIGFIICLPISVWSVHILHCLEPMLPSLQQMYS